MATATTTETPPQAIPEFPPQPEGRLGTPGLNQLKAWFGLPWQRRVARAALMVEPIRHWEKEFSRLSDDELKQKSMKLRGRTRGGESLDKILPEAFGLVCVVSWRKLGLRPFDVQLAAGVILHHGALAELATGEGKTLVAALPVYLNALLGKGVHVATVNDYLARRDVEQWTGPIYNALGLTVGVLQQQMPEPDRVRAYRSDITYGTASEFGFDFLRDRLKIAGGKGAESPFWLPWGGKQFNRPFDPKVQRDVHHYALVDEADNIFIDEARTPLIIANPTRPATPDEQVVYHWANKLALDMVRDQHFLFDEKKQKIELSEEGRALSRWSNPPRGEHSHAMDKLFEHIERALQSHFRFRRDQHYMIEKGKVVIIDEFTGRRMPDRHWRDGLHQAVEAKEGVQITVANDHAAQITYQSYFKLYKKLAGMTGTAAQNWFEIRRVYKIWVVCVPTNRPIARQQWPDRVFPSEDAKFEAVVEDIMRLRAQGRAILVGTRSVDKSRKLSDFLTRAGVAHQVLDARPEHAEHEADIVAQAGQPGKVTIATNMAGRGTDIKLGLGVADAGGLHVLGTERHEAKRIDRQLAGRCGRQGDPGSAQFFLSLEDELLEGLGQDRQDYYQGIGRQGGNYTWQAFHSVFLKGQRYTEKRHYRQRVDLMVYEKQRQEILKDLGADPYVD